MAVISAWESEFREIRLFEEEYLSLRRRGWAYVHTDIYRHYTLDAIVYLRLKKPWINNVSDPNYNQRDNNLYFYCFGN